MIIDYSIHIIDKKGGFIVIPLSFELKEYNEIRIPTASPTRPQVTGRRMV